MLIATFGPSTAWSGKTITREGDAFVLEGHGSISAGDIMEYDRQGHLLWVNDGARAWVGSKAEGSPGSSVAASTATPRAGEAPVATTGEASQPSSRKVMYLKRAVLLTIGILIVANVLLFLTFLGVFRGL